MSNNHTRNMSKRMVTAASSATGVILTAAAVLSVVLNRHDTHRSLEHITLPESAAYQEVSALPASRLLELPTVTPTAVADLPAETNLAIPFTSQAPFGTWGLPYKEFCEEASVLMVMRYRRHQIIATADDAAAGLEEIRLFEEAEFGSYADTTAQETAAIITKHFNYPHVRLVENPTVQDIKHALAAGQPVIAPAAGRALHNPFFTPPGPLYHMLVIKGYTNKNQFITNDPGTRRGADFVYDADVIMNALHNWPDNGNIEQGRAVVLIVG